MKNPLRRKIFREFKTGIEKYIIIFLFMLGTVSFVSGFLVAGDSMKTTYDTSFEKYNVEDGNFELLKRADDSILNKYENKDIEIYNNSFIEKKSVNNSTLRIFDNTNIKEINKVCLMKGKLPENTDEIAIDRLYADNNKLNIGDEIKVGKERLKISGLVALSNYSALFSNNNDMMFDSIKFGVAIVDNEKFKLYDKDNLHYSYAWKYNKEPKDDIEAKEKSEEFYKLVSKDYIVSSFTPRFTNQAINFAGDDIGGDRTMILVLMYILTVIIAFIFTVTISNTISSESSVIGTLRAMGYSRGELVRTYIAMPIIVTLIASILGNILGYTLLKDMVMNLYYGSYSLPTCKTIWNGEAFILTTIIPILIMIVINVLILVHKLSLSPQKFLRHDLSKKQKNKSIKLPSFKFLRRFRLRIVIQNLSNYLIMFLGIIFANVLLMFGLMIMPILNNYKDEVTNNMIAKYQYILRSEVETSNSNAEKYAVESLKISSSNVDSSEDISIYGVQENSKYINLNLSNKDVCISDGFADKYSLKVGDSVTLKERYGTKKYKLKVTKIYHYPSSIAAFINIDYFNDIFDNKDNYFNGYFSNKKITDINKNMILTTITKSELTKVSRQLENSMGGSFKMVEVFAIILYMVLIYLLSKIVIEKNATSISMVKVLGYSNREISKLYIVSTTVVVVLSVILSLPIANVVINSLYRTMMMDFTGWLPLTIEPILYIKMIVFGIAFYAFVAIVQFYKIKKIPMDQVLKRVE